MLSFPHSSLLLDAPPQPSSLLLLPTWALHRSKSSEVSWCEIQIQGIPAICWNGVFTVHCTYIRTEEFGSVRNFARNVGTYSRCKPWPKFRPQCWLIKGYTYYI
jgi:hypothetical protein